MNHVGLGQSTSCLTPHLSLKCKLVLKASMFMNLNLLKGPLPIPTSQHCWLDRQAHDRLVKRLLSLHTATVVNPGVTVYANTHD